MTTKNSKHLAIFVSLFIDLILEGRKTIESRFSKIRCAPYRMIKKGDIVLMKQSGGLVLGEFTVGCVETFSDLNKNFLEKLAKKYSKQLCTDVDKNFWDKRRNSRYATFLYVSNPIRYDKPFPYPKKDRRGWVVIDSRSDGVQCDLFGRRN